MSENDQENPDFGHNGQNSEGSAAKNEIEEMIDSVSRLQNGRVKAAKELLLPFTLFTMPDYRPNWHHAELAARLDRVARGECRRLMVFMPPQHGKSELVSRRFPAFLLGMNPRLRLMHDRADMPRQWENGRRRNDHPA
jgi:hypothetical protein